MFSLMKEKLAFNSKLGFLSLHPYIKGGEQAPLECTQEAGDVMFVPHSWCGGASLTLA